MTVALNFYKKFFWEPNPFSEHKNFEHSVKSKLSGCFEVIIRHVTYFK